jgi:acyl carrier protein
MLPPANLSLHQPLIRLGVDSLMALELETSISNDLGITIAAGNLLQDLTVAQLAEQLLSSLAVSDLTQPSNESRIISNSVADDYEIIRL